MSRQREPYDWESWAWDAIERHGKDLPPIAGLVLLRLAAHADAGGLTRPSTRRLAAMVGRPEPYVRDALAKLQDLGLIEEEAA